MTAPVPASAFAVAAAPLQFRPLIAGDAVLLSLQPSQHFEFGIEHSRYSMDEGELLETCGPAWTACRGSRIVGIAGFRELFPGHAQLWAGLSDGMGADHLACTRFARREIEASPYHRIEALVEADNARAVKWAKLVGLEPGPVLRGYGAARRDHILFEKVRLA